jgi:hypothetical protein
LRRKIEFLAAVTTEFELGGIDIVKLGAKVLKSGATVTAILNASGVPTLAFRQFIFSA